MKEKFEKIKQKAKWYYVVFGLAAVLLISSIIDEIAERFSKDEIPTSVEDVLEEYSEKTLLDDVIILAEGADDASLENIAKLENYLEIVEELEELGLKENKEPTQETIDKYSDLAEDEVKTLIEVLEKEDAKPVELERIKAGLSYLKAEYKNWISTTGLEVAEDLLKKSIKQAACDISGLEIENYNLWKISPATIIINGETVTATDPESKAELIYHLDDIYEDADVTLCKIQDLSKDSKYKEISKYCHKALDTAKIICASGAELDHFGIDCLSAPISKEKAKEKILQNTKK